ncbi:hypothetical protein MKW92_022613 [Papaver armeniacum]|nr:hypothetical protein MKW92_022613 [Papaver armeniacum]
MGRSLSLYFHVLVVLQCFVVLCLAKDLPAMFIFGDSLVEAGNNNYIVSLSKANYAPNGIDFGKPTGRYTNKRTIVDVIGQEFGYDYYIPPYLDPTTTGDVVLKGVNYASGGGGILNRTGYIFGGRINMDAQIDNFANTRQDIISSIGSVAASKLLEKAFVGIIMGSNDFLDNYLVPAILGMPPETSPEEFVDSLIYTFRPQLTRLYHLGTRKIVVSNVGPIGCTPYQRDFNQPKAGDSCVESSNNLAKLFNTKLKRLIIELNSNLAGSKFLYANVYDVFNDVVVNYKSYGFENPSSGCCHLAGKHGGIVPCGPPCNVCPDRSKYVFWDAYHPSDAANVIIARKLVNGDTNAIYPMNLRQLFLSSV